MQSQDAGTLVKLSETDETVGNRDEDIRNRDVKDRDRADLGKIKDLLIDDTEDEVRIDQTREHIAGAPAYAPELVRVHETYGSILTGIVRSAPLAAFGVVQVTLTETDDRYIRLTVEELPHGAGDDSDAAWLHDGWVTGTGIDSVTEVVL